MKWRNGCCTRRKGVSVMPSCCIPDTLINFPVVRTDDNAFYLSHDFTGDKSSAGCPFMDKDTQVWDFNRVIYGHNMGAGSDAMFSTLLDYEKEDYFKENQTIYFTDPMEVPQPIK